MKKILLIHGWNNMNYSKFGCRDAWDNRRKLVEELQKHYEVFTCNLPGFCGEPDPKNPLSIDDFANFIDRKINQIGGVDALLGYSFGAAVATTWKINTNSATPIILISPAIARRYAIKAISTKTKWIKVLLPEFIVRLFRYMYLKAKRNNYYTQATPVMRETYRNIIGLDLSVNFHQMNPEQVVFIFGTADTATPPRVLVEKLSDSFKRRVQLIENGSHDIATTHTAQTVNLIVEFLN